VSKKADQKIAFRRFLRYDLSAGRMSGEQVGRNKFDPRYLASRGLAKASLQRFQGKLILWGWQGLSPMCKSSGP
jgi:hypothetical protein